MKFEEIYQEIGTLEGCTIYKHRENGWYLAEDEHGFIRNRLTQTLDELYAYILASK